MPKGPRGEKRPADVVSNAVIVGRVATGEASESLTPPSKRSKSASVGGKARAAALAGERRKEIASGAAVARWGRKEVPMSEKQRLMRTLFDSQGVELLNIKFFKMSGETPVSEETFCAHINKIIFEIDSGLSPSSDQFDGDTDKTVNVKEISHRLGKRNAA